MPQILQFLGQKRFLVNDKLPSYADFFFFEFVLSIKHITPDLFSEFPRLSAYLESFESLPRLNEYLNDPFCLDKSLPFNNHYAKFGGAK